MLSSDPILRHRLRLEIQGAVQGVGFRPHVYRLARELGLDGWVVNDHSGVEIEVEGDPGAVERFAGSLLQAPPARARIVEVRQRWLPPSYPGPFHIRHSESGGPPTVAILPDLATCPRCLADTLQSGGPREGYPFTNCTECGPRLSIVRELPYDRPNTTMAGFLQCPRCQAEYDDPGDRRFHAQPNACPVCGPHLDWWDARGQPAEGTADSPVLPGPRRDAGPLRAAARALGEGLVVAVKGLGGFHLMADATNDDAVRRLRARKNREAKPLAVMVRDADAAAALAVVSPEARRLLESPEAPIVLLPARRGSTLAPSVAPGNPRVGVMVAYTPLHHLLLATFGGPVVATSGNRSEEPICVGNEEAAVRLRGIADGFLVHDRPIQRPVDDSVAVVTGGELQLQRRARGYAPFPVRLPLEAPPLLAVGGHLKNAVAVTRGRSVFVSQHIGDLENPEALDAFRRTVEDFLRLYRITPAALAHDLHPDYASTRWAREVLDPELPRIGVQHHHAHMASVLAEAGEAPGAPDAVGIIWDGTGYGTDGTIWGGEFLLGGMGEFSRLAHLRPFPLPGGERAVREPRRSALGLLLEAGLVGEAGAETVLDAFTPEELRVLTRATARGLNAPRTSSAGRLFDALSSLLGLRSANRFEGDAAMALEFAADPGEAGTYVMDLAPLPGGGWALDWEPLVRAALADRASRVAVPVVAARIHNGMVEGMVRVAEKAGVETVALSGGCFQNQLLKARARHALESRGHRVLVNREVPAGDGGIALGQAAVAAVRIQQEIPPSPGAAHRDAFPLPEQGV
ncbi:MAG TPA: carbamoyltransferase HypF [Longimicrobiales bacterium]|nr:carbamoyltransferase HypF [Longimicrobiales bacterium]